MTYGDNTMSPTKIGERNETFGSLESTREVSELRMKYIIINGLNDEMTHHAPHWACAWMVVRNYMEQASPGSASDRGRLFHGRRAGPGHRRGRRRRLWGTSTEPRPVLMDGGNGRLCCQPSALSTGSGERCMTPSVDTSNTSLTMVSMGSPCPDRKSMVARSSVSEPARSMAGKDDEPRVEDHIEEN